ncbi:MAG: phosphotransferase [Bacteroidia bacterium]|nr:phosphotransferase [Bacteroidia bacterium]
MDFLLNGEELRAIQQYLRHQQWIGPDESVESAKKPGEGNMNYTLRIRSNFRTFILKQSREFVEKYPSIAAPSERAIIEGKFYELIQQWPLLRSFTPEISFIDEENSILMMEDLGESSDFASVYQAGQRIKPEEISALMTFLSALHNEVTPEDSSYDFRNRAMRALNAEHIFTYPFLFDNGFSLDSVTEGLQDAAMPYKEDAKLKQSLAELEKVYLSDGRQLLHGDYYPGSWLRTLEGVKIIDPEFCFWGHAEFDLSVMMAHTFLASQDEEVRLQIMGEYQRPSGFSESLTTRLTGVEIMRRIIGLAQLPLSIGLEQKTSLLTQARDMIMNA